ncbi:MAG: lytic transglycosylase domain-containing protein [Alphaproteobacteria bacterium]|nr:lytic transglycosylase domain-containing protein [Alphaproteobacteria bacterium]
MAFFALFIFLSQPAHSKEQTRGIFSSTTNHNWQKTFNVLRKSNTTVARKLLVWLTVTETKIPIAPDDLILFTLENPGWPKLYTFHNRIEKNISASSLRSHEIIEWFYQNPPKSIDGIRVYIKELLRLGQKDKAKTALKKFWRVAKLNQKETAKLARIYRKLFSTANHADRLDNLLWKRRYKEASYTLHLVGKNARNMGKARIALGRFSSKASKLVRIVPIKLRNNEGFMYDRVKWRRKMNMDDNAFDLLQQMPKNPKHPILWWQERNILARRAIEKRNYVRAYNIIKKHGMTSGGNYAHAEWLLGWLSLRFLNQPDIAYQHFDNFRKAVSSAISQARGAYWLARTAETMKQKKVTIIWDMHSAHFPSTYYGQLSFEKLYGQKYIPQFKDDHISQKTLQGFESKEMVQAARLLSSAGLSKIADPFFVKLLKDTTDRSDFVMTARLARETGRHYFTVEANKQLQQKLGEFMFMDGYPLLQIQPVNKPEVSLVHAIVYRESMFDTTATSSAGARGLMQLMPNTARQVSKSIGKKFISRKLTNNPQYNIELGTAYLQSLLNTYNGSYPLAIAAYNAGPGNVDKWINQFGDPRSNRIDIIDWIEQIPFYETRNYVQRVMESYYIYRLRLSKRPKTILEFASIR